MKHLSALAAAALFALPIFAAEPAKKDAKTNEAAQPKVIQAAEVAAGDSPMVAAAKRANRLGKTPTNVITNETLKTVTGGHFTTTEQQYAVPAPPPPTQAEMQAKHNAEAFAQKQRQAAEEMKRKRAQEAQDRRRNAYQAADDAIDPYETDDPATAEYQAEQATKRMQEQKPPRP